MKKFISILFVSLAFGTLAFAQIQESIPFEFFAEGQKSHVQGIAFDKESAKMYYSFTTSFIKTDLNGKVIGTIEHIQGHLGAMTFNPIDRKVYASLECKDDVIGQGLSDFAKGHSMFYVAIIDVDKLNKIGEDSENNEIFKIVCVKEAGKDYADTQSLEGEEVEHKYGCSGIDGITVAPKFGKTGGKNFLYLAYGIYGDKVRSDNNYQVLLRYDLKSLNKYAHTVKFGEFYGEGPSKPLEKYFLFTGNTNWGVQNMAYDPSSSKILLAVYKGAKPEFQNFDMFAVGIASKPKSSKLEGVGYDTKKHPVIGTSKAPIEGLRFKYGSTGICALGDSLFYVSQNGKNKKGNQICNVKLYKWSGNTNEPFVLVSR